MFFSELRSLRITATDSIGSKLKGWILYQHPLNVDHKRVLADAPNANIKLGSPLNLERIEEGHDIYFDCEVDADPPTRAIRRKHNVCMTK